MWVVLSLILLIILMVLALRPTLVTISTLLGQIQQQKEISQKLDDKTLSVTTALKTLDSVKEKLPLLDNFNIFHKDSNFYKPKEFCPGLRLFLALYILVLAIFL